MAKKVKSYTSPQRPSAIFPHPCSNIYPVYLFILLAQAPEGILTTPECLLRRLSGSIWAPPTCQHIFIDHALHADPFFCLVASESGIMIA